VPVVHGVRFREHVRDLDQFRNGLVQIGALINNDSDFSDSIGGTPVDGAISGSIPMVGFGDSLLAVGLFGRTGGFGPQEEAAAIPTTAVAYTAPAPSLPWVGGVIANPVTQDVLWIVDGEQTYDVAVVRLNWSRTPVNTAIEYNWTVLAPPGLDSLSLPPLPTALADRAPLEDDSLSAGVVLFDYGEDDGYAALRARPEWEVNPFGGSGLPRLPLKIALSQGGFGRPATPTSNHDLVHAR